MIGTSHAIAKQNQKEYSERNLEALLGPGKVLCLSGGPGSSNCNIATSVAGVEFSCDVTCRDGYYACCSVNGCHCVEIIVDERNPEIQ